MRTMQCQRGMTLIMALIMLMVLTMLALTSFNLGKANLHIVSNMQQRDEAIAAAREVLEETISTTRLFENPTNVLLNPCGVANTRCVDTNGDGTPDLTVVLSPPTCVMAQAILNSDLNVGVAEDDLECTVGSGNDAMGTVGSASGASLCANSVWDVTAQATDNVTQAQVQVTQGIAVRVPATAVATSCP